MSESTEEPRARARKRLATVFGWVAGASLAMLLNYALFFEFGEAYPTVPTTFAAVVIGAFVGMAVADKLGPRGVRPLGIAAGVLLGLVALLAFTVVFAPR